MPNHLRAEMVAPGSGAPHIRPGAVAKLRLRALGGRLITGRVASVSPHAATFTELSVERFRSDPEMQLEEAIEREQERFVRVHIELDDPPQALLPGMTGYARVVVGEDRLWRAVVRPVVRFVRTEVWSWLP